MKQEGAAGKVWVWSSCRVNNDVTAEVRRRWKSVHEVKRAGNKFNTLWSWEQLQGQRWEGEMYICEPSRSACVWMESHRSKVTLSTFSLCVFSLHRRRRHSGGERAGVQPPLQGLADVAQRHLNTSSPHWALTVNTLLINTDWLSACCSLCLCSLQKDASGSGYGFTRHRL